MLIKPGNKYFHKNQQVILLAIKSKTQVFVENLDKERYIVNIYDLKDKFEKVEKLNDFERFVERKKKEIEMQVMEEMRN